MTSTFAAFCRTSSETRVPCCVRACVCQPLSAHSHHVSPTTPAWRWQERRRCFAPTPAVDLTLTDFDVRGQKSSRTQTNSPWLPAAVPRGARSQTARLQFQCHNFFYYLLYKFLENYKETHTPTDKITSNKGHLSAGHTLFTCSET